MRLGGHQIGSDILALIVAIFILLYMSYAGINLPFISVNDLLFLTVVLLIVKAVFPAGARFLVFAIILLFILRMFISLPLVPLLVLLLIIFLLFGFIG